MKKAGSLIDEEQMTASDRKATVLRCVAGGKTLKEASEAASITVGRARTLLASFCRELKLLSSLDDIRADPTKYLARLLEFKSTPQFELRKALVHDLIFKLKLKTESDLTPEYVSNITASQLLGNGTTLVAVTEIQEWLTRHGLSLKRRPPATDKEITEVKRAIAVLDVFYFDTASLKEQLQRLESEKND